MTRKLNEAERKKVMGAGPMRPIDPDEAPPFDFWPYFTEVPPPDFEGHDFSGGRVLHAYNSGHFQFVNVSSEDKNVFFVIVLDVARRAVHGHFLLDLNREYGLTANRPQ